MVDENVGVYVSILKYVKVGCDGLEIVGEAIEGINSVDAGNVGKTGCKTLGVRGSVWRVMGDCGSNDWMEWYLGRDISFCTADLRSVVFPVVV